MTRLMMLFACVAAMIAANLTAREAPASTALTDADGAAAVTPASDTIANSRFVIPPLTLKELQISVSGKPQMIFRGPTGSIGPTLREASDEAFDLVAAADLMPPPPGTYKIAQRDQVRILGTTPSAAFLGDTSETSSASLSPESADAAFNLRRTE